MPATLFTHTVTAPANAAFDISQLPNQVSRALWRGIDIAKPALEVTPTGFATLDAQLGGGWSGLGLTEILQTQAAQCEWRLLSAGLRQRVEQGGSVYLIGPPKRPHAPGLAQLGIAPAQLLWIAASTPAERLWACEQIVKANPAGAVLVWLPHVRAEQLRRLQVHAGGCDAPVFVFRATEAQHEASAAPLRLLTTLGPDWSIHLQILKRRGGHCTDTLVLPSIPMPLRKAMPPRLLRLGKTPPTRHTDHVLGRIAHLHTAQPVAH